MLHKASKIMKKPLLIAIALVLSFTGFSQSEFQLGLQLSPNISWLNPDSEGATSEGSSFGFSYGIIGDFNIADNYAFSTGITLLNMGGKLSYPDAPKVNQPISNGRTEANIRMKYVQIPLTLKLKTNQIGYMKYYGQFGLAASINYDSKADTDFRNPGDSSIFSKSDVDFGDEINLFRGSLIVGLGAEYNLSGNTSILIGLTFDNGFTNILSGKSYASDGSGNAIGEKNKDFKSINNSIVLNIGVLF